MLKRRDFLTGLTAALLPVSILVPAVAASGPAPVFVQNGQASWYGPGLGSRRTASGERLDQRRLTAAHRTLPLGCRVRVIHKETGDSIEVRINDRGPHRRGRIIDLSPAAAKRLDIRDAGLAHVVVEAYADAQPDAETRRALLDFVSSNASRGATGPARNRHRGADGDVTGRRS
jgi:rare lipoprotein A